jgi:hypothetical protein
MEHVREQLAAGVLDLDRLGRGNNRETCPARAHHASDIEEAEMKRRPLTCAVNVQHVWRRFNTEDGGRYSRCTPEQWVGLSWANVPITKAPPGG